MDPPVDVAAVRGFLADTDEENVAALEQCFLLLACFRGSDADTNASEPSLPELHLQVLDTLHRLVGKEEIRDFELSARAYRLMFEALRASMVQHWPWPSREKMFAVFWGTCKIPEFSLTHATAALKKRWLQV